MKSLVYQLLAPELVDELHLKVCPFTRGWRLRLIPDRRSVRDLVEHLGIGDVDGILAASKCRNIGRTNGCRNVCGLL